MIAELATCPLPAEIRIAAPEPSAAEAALDVILRPLQPLREQFTAITGLGLDVELPDDRGVRRIVRPSEGGSLAYLAAGQPAAQRVLLLHGSPGLAEEWAPFLTEVPEGQYRIAVDRPGFGDSGQDTAVVDLGAQARAVAPLLPSQDGPGAVLVGYSYGGPVALRLAADYPAQVAAVVLIGAAADPALEETHPLQQIAALEFFEALLPVELAHANAELLALRAELEDLAVDLPGIGAPVTMLQGLADTLVPPANIEYLRARLTAPLRIVMIDEADHFLPWTHVPLIEAALTCAAQDAADQSR
ncbi:alpha/beta fold hydrolase [Plastorhodobacter daqingensis]|uniref:Alpha/beta fold hydrolase n=1 Tax=Plastorhodobacter daqingensis TaxID=1387281 RepID=A0ABW2UM97_9RHOB